MSPTTKIGLFGFGRIGRNVFRQIQDDESLEVAAIVDIADPAALEYLLKYDTIFGRFAKTVDLEDGKLIVAGRPIPMLDHADPAEVDWESLGVDIVLQATRKHRTLAECRRHLDGGASRVILASTPENPGEIPILLSGANDEVLTPDVDVIALGSNTSNALAPVLKILDDNLGLEEALFTVVHAFTNQQRLADVPSSDLRSSRSAAENIIPTATDSPAIIEMVLPDLAGKLSGIALNVPVPDGSNVDLVAMVATETTPEDVNRIMEAAAKDNPVLGYTDEPIVSSDIIASSESGIVDGLITLVMAGTMVKMVVWFGNGWGYAARAVEVMDRMAGFEAGGSS